jgi:transcriptional regulator with XRE-family HTH domain
VTRLGRRIRRLREATGLSQEAAAGIAELDPKHWQVIEAGKTNTTVASLVAISKALHVKLKDLFDTA